MKPLIPAKLIGVRVIPWAKANLNYTAQALIISGGGFSGYRMDRSHLMVKLLQIQTQYSGPNALAGPAAAAAPAEETAPVPPGGLLEWNGRDAR